MRRAALIIGLVAVATAGALLVTSTGPSSTFRVEAVFDTAKGMVAGQQVKIAGADVGKVEEVELAPGPTARMVLSVDREFEPFHADASCRLLPEGLISENYVECDPGTPERGPLSRDQRDTLTIPVEHTAAPVSLQDVLNAFSLPTAERLRVIVNELGIGTAGRGADLNAVLRRANPALAETRRVLSIFNGQRRELANAVVQTDKVLAELGERDHDLRTFVDRSSAVATTTARHRDALGEAVRRLPAMLDAVRPGLRSLDRAAAEATPLLEHLRASAPGLRSLTSSLPSFARAGRPALQTLASAAASGRPAVRRAQPVISKLARASGPLKRGASDLDRLLVSVRDRGGIEGLLRSVYSFAVGMSTYDELSHLYGFHVLVSPRCIAAEKMGREPPGCSHKFDAPGQGTIPVNQPECGPQREWWPRCGDGFPPRPVRGGDADRRAEAKRDSSPADAPRGDAATGSGQDSERQRGASRRRDSEAPPRGLESLLDFMVE